MDSPKVEEHLAKRRDALIREVEVAFEDVLLGKGRSWTGSAIEDMRGFYEHEPEPNVDGQTSWRELVDNPFWNTFPGIGGFSFMDAEGFRYYAPAALIRTLNSGVDEDIVFHLTLEGDPGSRDYTLSQWADLSLPQCLCIKHVLEYMVILELSVPVSEYESRRDIKNSYVYKALDSYWKDVSEEGVPFRWAPRTKRKKHRRKPPGGIL